MQLAHYIQESLQLSVAAIAQLGERQTEDLKVPGSIPSLGMPPSHLPDRERWSWFGASATRAPRGGPGVAPHAWRRRNRRLGVRPRWKLIGRRRGGKAEVTMGRENLQKRRQMARASSTTFGAESQLGARRRVTRRAEAGWQPRNHTHRGAGARDRKANDRQRFPRGARHALTTAPPRTMKLGVENHNTAAFPCNNRPPDARKRGCGDTVNASLFSLVGRAPAQ